MTEICIPFVSNIDLIFVADCTEMIMFIQMVVTFGMSEIGPWSLMEGGAQSGDVIMRMMQGSTQGMQLLAASILPNNN